MRGPIAGAACLVLLCMAAVAQERHGDWAVRCAERDGLPPCEMAQTSAHKGEDGKQMRLMAFSVSHAGAKDEYAVQIVLPLGVPLAGGAKVRVDGGAALDGYGFSRCDAAGCFIERVAGAEAMRPLRAGRAGTVELANARGARRAVPFSLNGFGEALDKVVARNREWAAKRGTAR